MLGKQMSTLEALYAHQLLAINEPNKRKPTADFHWLITTERRVCPVCIGDRVSEFRLLCTQTNNITIPNMCTNIRTICTQYTYIIKYIQYICPEISYLSPYSDAAADIVAFFSLSPFKPKHCGKRTRKNCFSST